MLYNETETLGGDQRQNLKYFAHLQTLVRLDTISAFSLSHRQKIPLNSQFQNPTYNKAYIWLSVMENLPTVNKRTILEANWERITWLSKRSDMAKRVVGKSIHFQSYAFLILRHLIKVSLFLFYLVYDLYLQQFNIFKNQFTFSFA